MLFCVIIDPRAAAACYLWEKVTCATAAATTATADRCNDLVAGTASNLG